MEDEDDGFVTIGTAFDIPEEDEAPKKRFDKHGQIAVDSKGRRRFHGAFTGGFSAGYFNTVGTKEGWTPSTFKSSRSTRAANENSTQKPEDFMDEEDFGEHGIAPRMFMTKESFTPAEREVAERKRAINRALDDGILRSAVPGGLPVDSLITPSQVSIGVTLLRKMGWKEGQGVGAKQEVIKEVIPFAAPTKKIYGCSLPSPSQDKTDIDISNLQQYLAPKDLQPIDFRPKDNTHGIGYSGIDPNRVMHIGTSSVSGGFKPTGTEIRGIRGQAFGIGAFEEDDDDIYSMDDMSEYDFINTSERESGNVYNYGWSGPPKKDKSKGAIAGFNKASIPTAINKVFRPPLMPHNFIPKHEFSHSTKPMITVPTHASALTSSDRALLLGERTPKKALKSVFDIVPEKDKQKIESTKRDLENSKKTQESSKSVASKYAQSGNKTSRWDKETKKTADYDQSTSSQSSTLFKPFVSDPSKQKRYELFLSARKLGKDLDLKYDGSMTEWEKEREIEEFSRASILYRPMSTSISSRFTRGSLNEDSAVAGKKADNDVDEKSDCEKAAKLGLFGKLTRQAHDWYPSSLLCKRFNVPDPYPQSQFTGTIGRGKNVINNSLSSFGSTVPIDQSKTEDCLSERDDVNSDQFVREDTHRGSKDVGDHREVKEPIRDDFKTKVHSLQSSSAVSGPLSYLNDVDKEGKGERSEGGQNPENERKEADTKRPPMDLFKAIFADDSDSSDGESNNEEENIAKDDASASNLVNTNELMSKMDSLENKNENIVNKRTTEMHQPSFEIIASEMVDAKKSLSPRDANESLDVETERQSEAKKFGLPIRSSFGIKAVKTDFEVDQLTRSTENNKGRKGNRTKESYEEGKKKKKKEKKQKKKKKKEKRKVKMKKSREYDKDSSSEWSSNSDDDNMVSGKNNMDVYGPILLKKDRKTETIEKRTKNYDDMRHENPRFQKTAHGLSIGDKMGRSSNQDKSGKQYRKSRGSVVTGQDDKLSRERCRSGGLDRAKSDFMSSEIPKRSVVKTNKNEEKRKEDVPSATELYKKLKKHGLTLKRMSAADFM